jgi:hypothetical protein
VNIVIGHARAALFGEEDRGFSGIKIGVTAKTAKVRRYISAMALARESVLSVSIPLIYRAHFSV